MAGPKIQLRVPSYEVARDLSVELTVEGPDGAALLVMLGVAPEDVVTTQPVNGPLTSTGAVRPFTLTEAGYASWVGEWMRNKVSEHWTYRW